MLSSKYIDFQGLTSALQGPQTHYKPTQRSYQEKVDILSLFNDHPLTKGHYNPQSACVSGR